MTHIDHDILVIGAGMAGLSCAVHLRSAGHQVALIDKGRGPGGRMAARRVEIAGQTIGFDHGAQYFTARDPEFRAAVAQWEAAGAVAQWPVGGDEAFVGVPGMNGPIKAMASRLDVRWGVRAKRLVRGDAAWRVESDAGEISARCVLVAVPAEQASDLLIESAPGLAAIAGGVSSAPCWAVLVAFDEPVPLSADSLRSEGAIAWAARNSSKPGRAAAETWVIHASPQRSRELIDLPKEAAATVLLEDFCKLAELGALPKSLHLAAHRWLYALPQIADGPAAHYDDAARIGIAGDYLHSPRVEGAWLSGRKLAQALIAA